MKRRRAQTLMRDGLHYRREAFRHGLSLLGFEDKTYIGDPHPGDLLVIWNRSFRGAQEAELFERAGAAVLIAENGLLGKGRNGGNWYSLALHHVAGAGGNINHGGPSRWDAMGISLAPWRTGGTGTLILGQREIGEVGIKSPPAWAERTQEACGGKIRKHPGKHAPTTTLEQDLASVEQVVTWASSAALQALMLGVPVFYEHPAWVGAGAARPLAEFGQEPKRDDAARLEMFRRAAWAMWQIDEIDNGTALRHVLGMNDA